MKKLSMILPLALIFCFMVSCQDKEAMAELEKFRAQAKVEEQNLAIAKRIYEELNNRNVDNFMDMCSSDIAFYTPAGNTKPKSLEEYREYAESYFAAFPDYKFDVQDLIVKGDKVSGWYIFTGTHSGELAGIPAAGNKVEASVLTIFRINDGKIIEIREQPDMLGFYQQLGMELKPKEEK